MNIEAIKIEPEIAIKIFEEHGVLESEIYDVLKNDKPKYKKAGGNQYVAVGFSGSRYVTIFFRYDQKTKEADIRTAYPSDKGQIKSYKKR